MAMTLPPKISYNAPPRDGIIKLEREVDIIYNELAKLSARSLND
jgi:hypothetical protein